MGGVCWNATACAEHRGRTSLADGSVPIWQVRFGLAYPAAPRIGVWVLDSKRTHPLHDGIEAVSRTAVIVPLARWRAIYCPATTHGTSDSMNCQIEMTAERLVHRRPAIRRATAEVRCLQVHIDHVAQAALLTNRPSRSSYEPYATKSCRRRT
jgi:hypothetical protein